MKYFGDTWLEFYDYINGMKLVDVIEAQINMNIPFILPNEFGYYVNTKGILLNTLKCVKEIKNEKDESKHIGILEKYNLKPKDVKTETPNYMQ